MTGDEYQNYSMLIAAIDFDGTCLDGPGVLSLSKLGIMFVLAAFIEVTTS